jgi:hypothetical protein
LLLDNAKKVIDILDCHFNNAYTRHIGENEKQIAHIEPRQVEITTRRKTKVKYWTYVFSKHQNFKEYKIEKEE